jgi:hypothetical protein
VLIAWYFVSFGARKTSTKIFQVAASELSTKHQVQSSIITDQL